MRSHNKNGSSSFFVLTFFIFQIFATHSFAGTQPKVPVLFPMEAWYSIHRNGEKIGYLFSRYDWEDPSQKKIVYASTLMRKMDGKDFEEQLQETATADLHPVSLKYRSVGTSAESFLTIVFENKKARIQKKEAGKIENKEVEIPDGSVFGSFVNFRFLSLRDKMTAKVPFMIRVLDEGDYTIKDCTLKYRSSKSYQLSCQNLEAEYDINNAGLILSQITGKNELVVKKTSMKDAMKGFPKPGSVK